MIIKQLMQLSGISKLLEASKNMPKEIKVKYLLVPWDEKYLKLRNKISHEYFRSTTMRLLLGCSLQITYQRINRRLKIF